MSLAYDVEITASKNAGVPVRAAGGGSCSSPTSTGGHTEVDPVARGHTKVDPWPGATLKLTPWPGGPHLVGALARAPRPTSPTSTGGQRGACGRTCV
eukprot:351075-Chlamydomonas_euryale.AAC.3